MTGEARLVTIIWGKEDMVSGTQPKRPRLDLRWEVSRGQRGAHVCVIWRCGNGVDGSGLSSQSMASGWGRAMAQEADSDGGAGTHTMLQTSGKGPATADGDGLGRRQPWFGV